MDPKLQERLAQPLDASRVKERPNGRGGKLHYIETHDAIRAANEIFGFGGWGHEVVELRQIPGVMVKNAEGTKNGVCVGYVCTVRLTVFGCVPMGGVGYGDATEYRESATVTAHELAAKEAESDALKRALKNFGDQFGLALYDKHAESSGHLTGGATVPAGVQPAVEKKDDQVFSNPTTLARTEPQAKMLHGILPKLVKAGKFTDGAFIAAAVAQGAQGETVNAVIDTLTKGAASSLISRLKTLESNVAAGADPDSDIPFEPTVDGLV